MNEWLLGCVVPLMRGFIKGEIYAMKEKVSCLALHHPDEEIRSTGFSTQIGTNLRDTAVGHAEPAVYSQAALSSNDSNTRYNVRNNEGIRARCTAACRVSSAPAPKQLFRQ